MRSLIIVTSVAALCGCAPHLVASQPAAKSVTMPSAKAQLTPAPDQSPGENWRRCTDNNPDIGIEGCTAMIQSHQGWAGLPALVYELRGHAYDRKRQYNLAIRDYDRAIEIDPNDASAFSDRGSAYLSKKQYDLALQDYDHVIKLAPNSAAGFSGRGDAHVLMGQYDLAIRDYDQVIKLDPNIAAGFSGRGETYVFKEQYDRAIQDYDRAIKLDPNDAGYFSGRGNAHLEKGGRDYGFGDGVEYDRAIQDYTQAITLNPNLQCLAGEAITGDCPADEAVAGEVLARDFLQRGRVYFVRRQYDLAIQDYSQAIRLDPNYSYAFILRAAAYYATGQHNRAVQDDDEAVRLIGRQDPMLIHPLIFLGA